MRTSITARAAFENEPIEGLYTYSLYKRLKQAIAEYKATDNADVIREVIDTTIARSLRNVDGFTQRHKEKTRGTKKNSSS
jgi:hypothetical protein